MVIVVTAVALLVGAGPVAAAPGPSFSWATQAGQVAGSDVSRGVAVLADGSSIVTGYFQGTATFGATTLTSAGDNDVFVAKVHADGTWAWATRAGGSGNDRGMGVSSLADGSAIVTGSFGGTATFGATTFTSAGDLDVFAAKVQADGTWAWATRAGGTGVDGSLGISSRADGSSIVTGAFAGTATFGTAATLVGAGVNDLFVAKVQADGTWAWATQAGGGVGDVTDGLGVSSLADGSAIVTGSFEETAAFGATTLTTGGGRDVFVAKVRADGTWAWATQAGGTGSDFANGYGVSALADGSAVVAGNFDGTATFGAATVTSAGGADVFTARVNADGTWAWATRAGGDAGTDESRGVSALADGSAIVTGSFRETATFGATTLTSGGDWGVFVAKVQADGTWAWATRAGGAGSDAAFGFGVSALADGAAVVAGFFQGTATFGATTLTSPGGTNVFVARVQGPAPSPTPNPVAALTIDSKGAFRHGSIRLRVTVDRPGTLTTVGRYWVRGRPLRTACRGARTVAAAGTYTVFCRVNAATRMVLQRGPLRVGVRVTLTPTTGERATKAKSVRLERTPVRPVPVTG